MKVKLLKRIRKNWHIGISKQGTYIYVSKKGHEGHEWFEIENFFKYLLGLCGYGSIGSSKIVMNHFGRRAIREQPKMHEELINKLSPKSLHNK